MKKNKLYLHKITIIFLVSTFKNSTRLAFLCLPIIFLVALQLQFSYGTTVSLGWEFPGGYSLNDGGVGSSAIFFNVTDSSFAGNSISDTIPVTITSIMPNGTIRDNIILTLHEFNSPAPSPIGRHSDSNSGIFGITRIVFNPDVGRFSVGDTASVTQHDVSKANNGIIDTISVTVRSTTDASGITLTLTETGANTGIFTGRIKFDSTTSSATDSSIHVSAGDIVTMSYLGLNENMAIMPSPDGSIGGLKADVGDTVKISYLGQNANTTICVCGGGGGGGGGLIRPGLVLDIAAALGSIGGSPYVVQPPSFGGLGYYFADGLTFIQGNNKTIQDISHYNQELPRQVMIEGEKVNMTFKTFESYYAEGVIHMGVYLIPRGHDMITPESIASIEWNKEKPVTVVDPNHVLYNANASSNSDGKFQYTQFVFIPAKSYEKMSFLVRAWNDHRYDTDIRIHDAIDIPKSINSTLPAGIIRFDNFSDLQTALSNDQFYKPEILAHIHDTSSVFPSQQGKVYWLYDTVYHFVMLVIVDKNDNVLFYHKSSLNPYIIEKKGNYKFMNFTVKQLDRWNTAQIQKAMKIEEEKALSVAIEKRIMPQSNNESGFLLK